MTSSLSYTGFFRNVQWPAFLPKSPQLSSIALPFLHRLLIAGEPLNFAANQEEFAWLSLLSLILLTTGLACEPAHFLGVWVLRLYVSSGAGPGYKSFFLMGARSGSCNRDRFKGGLSIVLKLRVLIIQQASALTTLRIRVLADRSCFVVSCSVSQHPNF